MLPLVLLATPELPWERQMGSPGRPWLAVIVLSDDEIVGGAGSVRSTTAAVGDFLALTGVLVPPVKKESDVPASQPCSHVQLKASTFTAVMPRGDETPYLAHVRVVHTGDQALAGAGSNGSYSNGSYSVVVGNRFAATLPAGAAGAAATRNIVHLVNVWISAPGGQPAYCNKIIVAVPVGTGTGDFCTVAPTLTPSTSWWVSAGVVLSNGEDLGLAPGFSYAIFTVSCPSADHWKIDYQLVFSMVTTSVNPRGAWPTPTRSRCSGERPSR